ncbi:OmpA family protein [Rheinheimera hassiensis]|uniref:OmpA family protein n=1 Tax=Rheinheimera hassiensis TaxID=1193627 RepID=UPI001F065D57|nr:OmpA family protein [Rheinheimera hassiensis]
MHKCVTLMAMLAVITGCSAPTPTAPPATSTSKGFSTPINKNLVQHFVFFAFDNVSLPADVEEILAPHAKMLIANPDRRVLIEGLADETGDYHYNYVLGLKRANAVAKALLAQGVDGSQVIVSSLGVERPLNAKSDKRNRRVVLAY